MQQLALATTSRLSRSKRATSSAWQASFKRFSFASISAFPGNKSCTIPDQASYKLSSQIEVARTGILTAPSLLRAYIFSLQSWTVHSF